MKYSYKKPNSLLAGFVRNVLVIEGFSTSDSSQLPLFTNGLPALLCKTETDQPGIENIAQLALFGKSVPANYWTINDNTTLIAYFFKPFALSGIFNVAAKKLIEKPFDLCNWSPHKYNALRTQLIYSGSTSRKIEVLDHLLIHQLQQNVRTCEIIQYATDQMMCHTSTEILSSIVKEVKLTERTFQRIFKKYTGVTPTQYRRICQFQTSFAQLRTKQFEKISDVAFENGFSDQSHFIRSFKEYTDTTPNDYLRRGLTGKNQ